MAALETKPLLDREGFNWFREKVNHHYTLAKKLHRFKDYGKAPDLLADVSETEIEILKIFGLPEADGFRGIIDLFSWKEEIDEFDIRELFRTLKETAESYLLSAAKTDKQILIEAKETHLTAFDIFAMIGVEAHGYNIFLYEILFYTNGYDVEVIIQEMKKGNTIPADIVFKTSTNILSRGKLNTEFRELGLNFWKEFVEYEKIKKKALSKKTRKYFDIIRNGFYGVFPETFSFEEGYIHSIKYFEFEDPYVLVDMIVPLDLGMLPIRVYMNFEEVIRMLKNSTNHSISCMARSMLFENLKQNPEVVNDINIREGNNTYLYCKGMDLTIIKCNLEDNELEEEYNFYELDDFCGNLF